MKNSKEVKGYKPYEYKCSNLHHDPRTGLVSEFDAKLKGDGSRARSK